MTTIGELADHLTAHDHYLILTHRHPDGDTIGCATALCALLRTIGKTAFVLYNKEMTPYYATLVAPYEKKTIEEDDTILSVDIASLSLFPKNAESLKKRVELAIDHHVSHETFARHSYVDASCAACGEILWKLAETMEHLTQEIALPLYIAIATDTGCFVYSNTTAQTHCAAAALMKTGIDYASVNKRLFRTKTKKRLALEAVLLQEMEYYDNGRICLVVLSQALRKQLSLKEEDTEDIASLAGVVEGCDCSITMKETEDGKWKVSLRTGKRVNASEVCQKFGGGGHKAAAGCVLEMELTEAKHSLLQAVEETAEEAENA